VLSGGISVTPHLTYTNLPYQHHLSPNPIELPYLNNACFAHLPPVDLLFTSLQALHSPVHYNDLRIQSFTVYSECLLRMLKLLRLSLWCAPSSLLPSPHLLAHSLLIIPSSNWSLLVCRKMKKPPGQNS
jgi:hypothetical protein